MLAVSTQNLTKTYPARAGFNPFAEKGEGFTAVSDLSLDVEQGELFGLLGPNGAGKTTLVKMLCTLIEPTSGTVRILDHDISNTGAIRSEVGLAVTDERSFFWRITARQNLKFFAALHGMYGAIADKRVDAVLDTVYLLDRADTRFSDFSTGMKQRMAIARSILHQPRILFLDEPSRSLDPTSTNQLHEMIQEFMQDQKMTVFLITHDLIEAEKMCDRVAVITQGKLRAVGSASDLRTHLQPLRAYSVHTNSRTTDITPILKPLVQHLSVGENRIEFSIPDQADDLTPILDLLLQNGITIDAIDSQAPSLEEIFAQLTQEKK